MAISSEMLFLDKKRNPMMKFYLLYVRNGIVQRLSKYQTSFHVTLTTYNIERHVNVCISRTGNSVSCATLCSPQVHYVYRMWCSETKLPKENFLCSVIFHRKCHKTQKSILKKVISLWTLRKSPKCYSIFMYKKLSFFSHR